MFCALQRLGDVRTAERPVPGRPTASAFHSIRVNSISPGAIVTGIFGKSAGLPSEVADQKTQTLADRFATLQPIPRAGMPDDIAQAAVFLASDASSFVNGHDLVVDGGLIDGRPFSVSSAAAAAMGAGLRQAALS